MTKEEQFIPIKKEAKVSLRGEIDNLITKTSAIRRIQKSIQGSLKSQGTLMNITFTLIGGIAVVLFVEVTILIIAYFQFNSQTHTEYTTKLNEVDLRLEEYQIKELESKIEKQQDEIEIHEKEICKLKTPKKDCE